MTGGGATTPGSPLPALTEGASEAFSAEPQPQPLPPPSKSSNTGCTQLSWGATTRVEVAASRASNQALLARLDVGAGLDGRTQANSAGEPAYWT